jgi:hypothetical protein
VYDLPGNYTAQLQVRDQYGFVNDPAADASDTVDFTIYRPPADVMLVLDASGSMFNDSKFDRMAQTAEMFYDLYYNLANPADDRFGMVFFKWNGSNTTEADPSLSNMSSDNISTPFTTHAPTTSSTPLTPIWNGVQAALDQFPDPTGRKQVILILSDGKQNRGLNYSDITIPADVTVFSIGVGEGTAIDPTQIEAAAIDHGGEYMAIDDTSDVDNYSGYLDEHFSTVLQETLLKMENTSVNDSGTAALATLASGTNKAVFILSWINAAHNNTFSLDPPDAIDGSIWNPVDSPVTVGSVTATFYPSDSNSSHSFWIVGNSSGDLAGDWQMTSISDPGATKLILEDLRVRTKFAHDRNVHYAGDPILLTAQLRDGGRPITGAEVYVEVNSPETGTGDVLVNGVAQYGIINLLPTQFRLAAMDPQPGPGKQKAINYPAVMKQLQSAADKMDNSAKGVLYNQVLEAVQTAVPPRLDDKLMLYDDGSHGDAVAGDGIYSLSYQGADEEGNCNFRFTAKGKSLDGKPFARTRIISDYIRIRPDSDNSSVDIDNVNAVDLPANMAQATVIFRAKDKLGNYLGPFHSDKIQFETNYGKLDGRLIDRFDGTYSMVLTYDKEAIRDLDFKPKVTVFMESVRQDPIVSAVIRPPLARYMVGVKVGIIYFDENINIGLTPVYDAFASFAFNRRIFITAEGGYYIAEDKNGARGNIFKAGGNLQLNILDPDDFIMPYLTAGGGIMNFSGFTTDDNTYHINFGVGAQKFFTASIGVDLDIKDYLIRDFAGANWLHNFQARLGVLYRF